MQPITLCGSRNSGSAAIEMALRAAAVPYTVVRASEWGADSAQAELLQANPLGQVPTLVLADGTVLTESAAILIHLGLAHPGHRISAGLAPARAEPGALAFLAVVVSRWSGTRLHLAAHGAG